MLGDALVYSVSLFAVSRGPKFQYAAARLSGIVQLLLAFGVVTEVARRAMFGSEPQSVAMMGMAIVALLANLTCIWLLRRFRDSGVHMQASWIFSTNDAVANFGVVIAGGLVLLTGSSIPDLVIGTVIAVLVGRSALRILRLPRPTF
jgi:Co/Zn/Cd efflux system component